MLDKSSSNAQEKSKTAIEMPKEVKIWLAKEVLASKASRFHSKLKEQTSTAIITAFGLVVALAWKDVITDLILKLNPAQNLLISAIIITIISVLGIALVSRWAKYPDKN